MGRIVDAARPLFEETTHPIQTDQGTIAGMMPPLGDVLDELVVSSVGGTAKGSTAAFEKCIVNFDAMKLRDDIRSLCIQWMIFNHKPLKAGGTAQIVAAWAKAADDLHQSTSTPVPRWESEIPESWVTKIRDLYDPPHVIELEGSCPKCDAYRVEGKHALTALYRLGDEPYATCASCGTKWEGQTDLLALGYHLNAVAA